MYLADHVDNFHMYPEMGDEECTDMLLKFQDSKNFWVFITIPKVGGKGENLTVTNHEVITYKFWVLN